MYGIAGLPSEEREILFQNTAAKMGMNAAVIEKDFWVCLKTIEKVYGAFDEMKAILSENWLL